MNFINSNFTFKKQRTRQQTKKQEQRNQNYKKEGDFANIPCNLREIF